MDLTISSIINNNINRTANQVSFGMRNPLTKLTAEFQDMNFAPRQKGLKKADRRGNPKEIIALNQNGSMEVFDAITEAAKATNKRRNSISAILRGERPYSQEGWHFAYARNLKDKSGNLDPTKVQELIKKIFKKSPNSEPITPRIQPFIKAEQKAGVRLKPNHNGHRKEMLALHADGTVKVFESQQEAAEKFGLNTVTIYKILAGIRNATMDGWHFAYAKDLKDKTGRIDQKKIEDLHKTIFKSGQTYTKKAPPEPIIAISRDGEVKRFETRAEAAKSAGICPETISYILRGDRPSTKTGWIYIRADKMKDETGEISQAKIEELRKKVFESQKIIGLNKNGQIAIYKSRQDAEKATKTSKDALSKILNGKRTCSADEWHFIYADKLRDETGKIPKSKVKEHFEKIFGKIRTKYTFGQVVDKKIIGIHYSGQIKLLKSLQEAEETANRNWPTILKIINGERPATRDGWHFDLADKFRGEDGKISKEKIQERYKSIFKDINK